MVHCLVYRFVIPLIEPSHKLNTLFSHAVNVEVNNKLALFITRLRLKYGLNDHKTNTYYQQMGV